MNFYDNTPFKFGFTSRSQIIEEMHPYLKKVIREAKNRMIADIGCGCGRNLIYASRYSDSLIGIDLSKESLAFAESLGLSDNLELIYGDNLDIPLASNHIDLVISDGVIHHTGDTYLAFRECIRVLKPGGKFYCLEFCTPATNLINLIYSKYKNKVIPIMGDKFAKDFKAYKYLEESIDQFPHQDILLENLREIGFQYTSYWKLFDGIVCIHKGFKI